MYLNRRLGSGSHAYEVSVPPTTSLQVLATAPPHFRRRRRNLARPALPTRSSVATKMEDDDLERRTAEYTALNFHL